MTSNWKGCKVENLGKIITGKTPRTSIKENYGGNIPFLTPSDDMSIKYVNKTSKNITELGLNEVKNCLLPAGSICVSCIGSDLGKVVVTTEPTVTNQQINSIIINQEFFDVDFCYYLMVQLGKILNYHSKTSTAVPIVNKSSFSNYEISVPLLETQQKIAKVLSAIDDKIELNNSINNNLEQQAQAIFNKKFVNIESIPNNWEMTNLSTIADYLNGLAMQKFRPQKDEIGIPVLKIKELRQGFCDNQSDLCSPNIKSEYLINDGDVIFSWSGTLWLDLWCSGLCGLNQHLFKVTSSKYDKWFYYFWTKYHLNKFIAIAADKATTMGHIKREDLDKSEVLIPDNETYTQLNSLLSPLLELIIKNKVENRHLIQLRDTLLPKLMSGEIDVSNVDISTDKLSFSENNTGGKNG